MDSGSLSPTEMAAEMVDLEVDEEENRRGLEERGWRGNLRGREEKERREEKAAVAAEGKRAAEEEEEERESLEMEK